jgi:hypothetical protein
VRKIAAKTAPGLFEVETIPRTGYRLTGEIVRSMEQPSGGQPPPSISRRRLIMGGGAVTALAAGSGLWWVSRKPSSARFNALMQEGDEAFHNGTAFEDAAFGGTDSPAMIGRYEKAVRLNPGSAKAWGLLAYFKAAKAEGAPGHESPGPVDGAQAAIRMALQLDANEPNARVAMFLLQGPMFDWATRDRQLRGILATDPLNLPAMMELMPLLQAAGLTRESWIWNERMLQASPFLRPALVVRALKLWILGRVRDADNVIDRVVGLWPDYSFAINARFTIFTLTGRPRAARALLEKTYTIGAREMRMSVLDALETKTPSAIEAARAACLKTAATSPPIANDAVMYLCALGLPDTAFEVTEGFLLWRGSFVSMDPANKRAVDAYSRRMTQWLFTPPVADMRRDPRFAKLCDEFGLTAYWRARHVRPDYQVYG